MICFIIVVSILNSISLYYILFVVVFGLLMVFRKKDTCQVYIVMILQVLQQRKM